MSGAGNEERYFAYSASLRIFGDIQDLAAITRELGVEPTSVHVKGEHRRGSEPPAYRHDTWSYQAPIAEHEKLGVHLDALWNTFEKHKDYLLRLKQTTTVDIFCGYRTNCDHAGVEVSWRSLQIFHELQIPFGISIIVTGLQ